MKTSTLAVALLLVAATAFATEKDKRVEPSSEAAAKTVAIINNNPQEFKLIYLLKEQGKVKINLKNADGFTLHQTTVKNDGGFAQPYDLKDLPEGQYTFEINTPDGSVVDQQISIEKPDAEPAFAADILNVNDGKKFRLAVVNKNDWALPTSIKVYDEKENLIHSEQIENLYGFRKIYDLSEVASNSFRFAISNATGTRSITAD